MGKANTILAVLALSPNVVFPFLWDYTGNASGVIVTMLTIAI